MFAGDAFGMELDAVDRQSAVGHALNRSVVGGGRHREALRHISATSEW